MKSKIVWGTVELNKTTIMTQMLFISKSDSTIAVNSGI